MDRAIGLAIKRFSEATFGGIVFDLDGTLVEGSKGEYAPESLSDVKAEFRRLITQGVQIAIVTGRGASNRTLALLRSIVPEAAWPSVLVGYHNGAELAYLSETGTKIVSVLELADRENLLRYFSSQSRSSPAIDVVDNSCQIEIRPTGNDVTVHPYDLFGFAQEAIVAVGAQAKAVVSSHSVDLIHVKTSNRSVTALLSAQLSRINILTIGDSGAWPGNDFELLSHPYGLSVDTVSASLSGCWNLLPAGIQSVEGTVHYLKRLRPTANGLVSFGDRLLIEGELGPVAS